MKQVSIAILALASLAVFAQQPASAGKEVTVKDTPASLALVELAKDTVKNTKNFNDILQQAKFSLDQNNKALTDEVQKSQKALDEQLLADKHYKNQIDHIKDLQRQITESGSKAQQEFQKKVGPIQQNITDSNAQIKALIPIVRKENDLPENAVFSNETGKWTVPPPPAPAAPAVSQKK